MKLTTFVLCPLAAIGILACPEIGNTQDARTLIARIECKAVLTDRSGRNSVPLVPNRDVARQLSPGDTIRCTDKGFVELTVFGRDVKVYQSQHAYMIPPLSPEDQTPQEKWREDLLNEYCRRGGRERSPGEPEADRVTPTYFFIVLPADTPTTLLVSIKNAKGEEIWSGNVRNHSGLLESDNVKKLVAAYQESGGGVLTISFMHASRSEHATYVVLTPSEEAELRSALDQWNPEPSDVMRHIARATILSEDSLFEAAGNEYAEALESAPKNPDLRQAAIEQYRFAGDEVRASILEGKPKAEAH